MTCEVINHRLVWDNPNLELKWDPISPKYPREITPTLIVCHYGVTRSLPELVRAQRARGYWAHLSIDGFTSPTARLGTVYQVHQALPFNMKGSHAGESSWKGRKGCNDFSIGIEISNPGPLLRGADGKLRTVHGQEWPEDEAIEAQHRNQPQPKGWDNWAIYTDQEFDILITVCRALVKAYPTIDSIAGHDEIAPFRKWDPGPAFQIDYLREMTFGK